MKNIRRLRSLHIMVFVNPTENENIVFTYVLHVVVYLMLTHTQANLKTLISYHSRKIRLRRIIS